MKSLFRNFLAPEPERQKVAALYGGLMTAARQPAFFEVLGLPDSFESRFDLLVLHMFLMLDRLKREGGQRGLMRALTEYMVDDLDRTLREMGIGDVGVAKRMKKLVSGFYGRMLAYDKALASADDKEILRALDRNLFAALDTDIGKLTAMRGYIVKQKAALVGQRLDKFVEGNVDFLSNAF